MIRIVIADDQELVRESLKMVLNTMEDMLILSKYSAKCLVLIVQTEVTQHL